MKPWVRGLLIGIPIVVVLPFLFVFKPYRTPSSSMTPTLVVGDHVEVNQWAKQPRRGDVVVFAYPQEPAKDFIKRVIAVGGDTVELRDDVVYVNGQAVPRRPVDGDCQYPEVDPTSERHSMHACRTFDEELDGRHYGVVFDRDRQPRSSPKLTLPAGQFFVLGDNRDYSHDSRHFGLVPAANIRGTATFIAFSFGPEGVRGSRIGKRVH
jgi:signal peptidase I